MNPFMIYKRSTEVVTQLIELIKASRWRVAAKYDGVHAGMLDELPLKLQQVDPVSLDLQTD